MKLNNVTLEVLKNFATINQGILFKPGNILKTMAVAKNTFVVAQIPDEIPREFALYDLNEFLAAHSLIEECDVAFDDEKLILTNNNETTFYFYSSPNVIVSAADKNVRLQETNKKFILEQDVFNKIMKNSNVMKLKDLEINENGIVVMNRNSVGNKYKVDIEVECIDDATTPVYLKIENLKLIPLKYEVSVCDKGIVLFQSVDDDFDIEYYVALETA